MRIFSQVFVPMIVFSLAMGPLFGQTKEGFYDTNNYDLRNLPKSDPESNILPEVTLPPKFETPALATPKNVKTQYTGIESIPGAGALMNSRTTSNSSQNAANPYNLTGSQNLPINPLTGEINEQALQNQLQKSRVKQELKKKQKEEFDEDAVYEETKFRRAYIIFFLTLPFALGASAAVASAFAIEKTLAGSIIMIGGSTGLSGVNAYADRQRLEEHREKKKQLAEVFP
ncbi:hypothetical protein ND861_03455 [Leptospira sp. 2 VSF19]|uniref:Type VI secretion protein n=1 Tax=Leptospira soteropolitanensis TaxID=2950025 RepID=A0AAW5VDE5_9LEPT|nr:hypothetical protein [Leptospira soteropolitanensis]MCW7491702.1 hypothetical protein [Leptospira soteropolitanensis]MCW7499287.1 hypothetical protein [Leptospira soteropolitanensis]MCW7521122.1 hypothetical protein [Leptospira soteropolitanensis]MCW7525390.1 hypothetical protein [Leptospira soteropolitanensis]MCW7529257.1 hypothetical protein [Leptospira soteropolitanensis]